MEVRDVIQPLHLSWCKQVQLHWLQESYAAFHSWDQSSGVLSQTAPAAEELFVIK